MSDSDDIWRLEARVRRIEWWMNTVMRAREPKAEEPSRVERLLAACRERGVSEERIAEARAECRDDDLALADMLEELVEEGTLRGRMRRGGLDPDREDD